MKQRSKGERGGVCDNTEIHGLERLSTTLWASFTGIGKIFGTVFMSGYCTKRNLGSN